MSAYHRQHKYDFLTENNYRVAQNKWHSFFVYALTSSNINRFSKLFYCQNQNKMCNNTITKDPTTPQMCSYTTLWNVKCLQSIDEVKAYKKLCHLFWATLYKIHESTLRSAMRQTIGQSKAERTGAVLRQLGGYAYIFLEERSATVVFIGNRMALRYLFLSAELSFGS